MANDHHRNYLAKAKTNTKTVYHVIYPSLLLHWVCKQQPNVQPRRDWSAAPRTGPAPTGMGGHALPVLRFPAAPALVGFIGYLA
jgi:hypothetical protein